MTNRNAPNREASSHLCLGFQKKQNYKKASRNLGAKTPTKQAATFAIYTGFDEDADGALLFLTDQKSA